MPLNDVSDLVSECAGELVEPVGALDESAVDVDVATRKRERVYLRGVDHVEMPVEIRATRGAGDLGSELLDVRTDNGVSDDGELRIDLIGVLATERDLLIFGNTASEQNRNYG